MINVEAVTDSAGEDEAGHAEKASDVSAETGRRSRNEHNTRDGFEWFDKN